MKILEVILESDGVDRHNNAHSYPMKRPYMTIFIYFPKNSLTPSSPTPALLPPD